MKILIVSFYMPPDNVMGALRVGKFAHFLDRQGHDVRVLSGADLPFDKTLKSELAEDRYIRIPYWDVNRPLIAINAVLRRLRGTGGSPAAAGAAAATPAPTTGKGLLSRLREIYQEATNFPDAEIAWRWPAVRGAWRALRGWRPDIVFASAPPFTDLMVGRRLSRKWGVPWVAEYRDRYLEDPYSSPSRLRHIADKWFEDRLLRGVSGIATVSEPWAADYRARLGLPVACIYNGYDSQDFPEEYPRGDTDPNVLRIVYTGILYSERRDPSPLFQAIALMGEAGRSIQAEFYGADEAVVQAMAARHGVGDRVRTHPRVSYSESIRLQMQADVLLLLQWNNPKELGNVPGKLFEYLGARRPVLGIGIENGVPAGILKERNVGIVLNDPQMIADRLGGWQAQKRSQGQIPLMPVAAREGFSRDEQYRKLEEFLIGFVPSAASPATACRGC